MNKWLKFGRKSGFKDWPRADLSYIILNGIQLGERFQWKVTY